MRNKLSGVFFVFIAGLFLSLSAQAAELDFSALDKLSAEARKSIYQSALEMNKDAELDLSTIGLANASLQEAIMSKLDQYADKGGVVPIYKFPTDKIEEVAALLSEHEKAEVRMQRYNEEMKKVRDMVHVLERKIAAIQ